MQQSSTNLSFCMWGTCDPWRQAGVLQLPALSIHTNNQKKVRKNYQVFQGGRNHILFRTSEKLSVFLAPLYIVKFAIIFNFDDSTFRLKLPGLIVRQSSRTQVYHWLYFVESTVKVRVYRLWQYKHGQIKFITFIIDIISCFAQSVHQTKRNSWHVDRMRSVLQSNTPFRQLIPFSEFNKVFRRFFS